MTPYYADDWLQIFEGDCRDVLATLPADSVDCVVTSPPYWGLRDYGHPGQLGLERTPEEYVTNMTAVFREVRRVLKPSGTCWLNLGDSYAAQSGPVSTVPTNTRNKMAGGVHKVTNRPPRGLKPKDLVGIPWRVAFALQADGWYLRSDIIWSKPNPMPESVTDRPTKAHEYLFLLAKSGTTTCWRHRAYGWAFAKPEPDYVWRSPDGREESTIERDGWKRVNLWRGKDYYYEHDAIAERVAPSSVARLAQNVESQTGSSRANGGAKTNGTMKAVASKQAASAATGSEATKRRMIGFNTRWDQSERAQTRRAITLAREHGLTEAHIDAIRRNGIADAGKAVLTQNGNASPEIASLVAEAKAALGGYFREFLLPAIRNARSVWTIPTRPYADAHFAVFPPELPERCIKAGSPEGGVILDPFGGSGTVGMVANRLSRRAILIDLNPEYLKQQLKRAAQTPLGLSA